MDNFMEIRELLTGEAQYAERHLALKGETDKETLSHQCCQWSSCVCHL